VNEKVGLDSEGVTVASHLVIVRIELLATSSQKLFFGLVVKLFLKFPSRFSPNGQFFLITSPLRSNLAIHIQERLR
jgi:hypothetical protein